MKKRVLTAALVALSSTVALADPPAPPPAIAALPAAELPTRPSAASSLAFILNRSDMTSGDQLPSAAPAPLAPVAQAPAADLPVYVVEDLCCPCVPRAWVNAEYLFYFMSPSFMPPLVTTGTVASGGVIGQPGARVLIGGDVDYGTINGFRFSGGLWCNPEKTVGVEGSTQWLESRGRGFAAASDGTILLARPITNALTGGAAAATIAAPGLAAGNIAVQSRVRFNNHDLNLMGNLYRDDRTSLNALLGLRYLYLQESMTIVENQQFLAAGFGRFLGNALPAGATETIRDRFATQNDLFAGQMGLNYETARGKIRIGGSAKVGLGWSHQRTVVAGSTTSGGVVAPGGILVLPTYATGNTNDTFVVIPEMSGRVGYQFTERLSVFASYTMLYASSVARPGREIDTSINPNQVPSFQTFGAAGGPARPTFPNRTSDLFVHGISLGLDFKY